MKPVWIMLIPVNVLALSMGVVVAGSGVVVWLGKGLGFDLESALLEQRAGWLQPLTIGLIGACCVWIAAKDNMTKSICTFAYFVAFVIWGTSYLTNARNESFGGKFDIALQTAFMYGGSSTALVIFPTILFFSVVIWCCKTSWITAREYLKRRHLKSVGEAPETVPMYSDDLSPEATPLTNQNEIHSASHDRLDCSGGA